MGMFCTYSTGFGLLELFKLKKDKGAGSRTVPPPARGTAQLRRAAGLVRAQSSVLLGSQQARGDGFPGAGILAMQVTAISP